MGSTAFTRNRILSIVWWLKVVFAFSIAAGGLIGLSINVALKHYNIYNPNPNVARPIVIDQKDPVCSASAYQLGRVEPPAGKVYTGFNLDWKVEQPAAVAKKFGKNPAIYGAFLDIDQNSATMPFDFNMLAWHGNLVQLQGGIFLLTIQPTREIASVPQSLLDQVAQALTDINKKGVPILLRYGHEMNGDWTSYGVRPLDYVKGFQDMANTIKKFTNLTAMVWGPNLGTQYPFNNLQELTLVTNASVIRGFLPNEGGQYPTMASDPANFRAIDTNGNGFIDVYDNPYSPYYPGDDYVDWVALSLYWYPMSSYDENRPIPEDTYFVDHLSGSTGPSISSIDGPVFVGTPDRDFYGTYAAAKGKPFIVPETAAPWFPALLSVATTTEADLKQSWWQQIHNPKTYARFPLMKGVVQFEESKNDYLNVLHDYRLLENPSVAKAFIADTDALSDHLVYANQIGFNCAGQVSVTN